MNVTPEIEAKVDRLMELRLMKQEHTREFVDLAVSVCEFLSINQVAVDQYVESRRQAAKERLGLP